MSDNNKKKNKEFFQISNILPSIKKALNEEVLNYERTESPDFVFKKNDENVIGLEVIECLPSVQKRKENNPEQRSFNKKVCREFSEEPFFKEFTKNKKLNVQVYLNKILNKHNKMSFKKELEICLKGWREGKQVFNKEHIFKLAVYETTVENVVYIREGGRLNPLCWDDILYCISSKTEKLPSYHKINPCQDYWLCIFLPQNELKSLDLPIDYMNRQQEALDIINKSGFSRIYLTQDFSEKAIDLRSDLEFQLQENHRNENPR